MHINERKIDIQNDSKYNSVFHDLITQKLLLLVFYAYI